MTLHKITSVLATGGKHLGDIVYWTLSEARIDRRSPAATCTRGRAGWVERSGPVSAPRAELRQRASLMCLAPHPVRASPQVRPGTLGDGYEGPSPRAWSLAPPSPRAPPTRAWCHRDDLEW